MVPNLLELHMKKCLRQTSRTRTSPTDVALQQMSTSFCTTLSVDISYPDVRLTLDSRRESHDSIDGQVLGGWEFLNKVDI